MISATFDEFAPSPFGWIIHRDLLAEEYGDADNAVGTMGPHDVSDEMAVKLRNGEGYTFTMYDDDGIAYYRGKAIADDDALGCEDFCYAPLGDFGMPDSGCTEIRWHGHKEWNCS